MSCPNCFECKNAEIFEGFPATYYEPGEPDIAECTLDDIEEDIEDIVNKFNDGLKGYEGNFIEEVIARHCGHFDPIIIKKCSVCGSEMNVPRWSWYIWAHTWDTAPACSQECKEKAEKEFDEKLKEEEEYYKKIDEERRLL